MFERIELNPQQAALWRSLTKEQKSVITILAENFDEVNTFPEERDWTFVRAMLINDVDAATYTTVEQYLVWRSVTQEQKELVLWIWQQFFDRYNDALVRKYDEEEVYNMDISYNMYGVYFMFSNQDQLGGINDFRFFNNQND